ncbi:hypothetical protein XENOCAPTIV_006959, partial [Xenoophorus captivus]
GQTRKNQYNAQCKLKMHSIHRKTITCNPNSRSHQAGSGLRYLGLTATWDSSPCKAFCRALALLHPFLHEGALTWILLVSILPLHPSSGREEFLQVPTWTLLSSPSSLSSYLMVLLLNQLHRSLPQVNASGKLPTPRRCAAEVARHPLGLPLPLCPAHLQCQSLLSQSPQYLKLPHQRRESPLRS